MSKIKRIIWLDIARTIAIISISSNHAINRAFLSDESVYDTFIHYPKPVSFLYAVIFVFSRVGVPLFLMITGVLILNKEFENQEDVKRFYKHNLLSIFITSEIWYFLMFWYRTILRANDILAVGGIKYALIRCIETMLFINQETMHNMWYIPMILCVYLLLPYVSIVLRKVGNEWLWIPIAIIVIEAMLVPNINHVLLINGISHEFRFGLESANLFSPYLVFILMGYYIYCGLLKSLRDVAINLTAIFSFVICVVYQYWEFSLPKGGKIAYDFMPLAVCSVFVFEVIRRYCDSDYQSRTITYISRISFGIFFVHIFITSALARIAAFNSINPILTFIILEVISVGGSIVFISLLSKVPIFKKYVFLIK